MSPPQNPSSDFNSRLSPDEIIVLQELMNIAFGTAGAELEEILDINVELHIPDVQLVPAPDLSTYLHNMTDMGARTCIVEQQFWGDFKGTGYMMLPRESGEILLSVFGGYEDEYFPETADELLEQGAILEVGNILTGACIGKVAELLDTAVTYTPPQIRQEDYLSEDLWRTVEDNATAIILKTRFNFQNAGLSGYVFIVTREDAISWLKTALVKYLKYIE